MQNFLFLFNSADFSSAPSEIICGHNRIRVDCAKALVLERAHTHTQSSPRSGRQFITNTSYTFAWHYVSSRCSLLPYFDWSAPENIYACIRICETEWASGCGIHRESNSFCIQSYCVVGILFCFFSLLLFVCHHGSCGVPAIKWISSVRFSGAEDASVLCETIRQCLIRGLYRNEIISNSIP